MQEEAGTGPSRHQKSRLVPRKKGGVLSPLYFCLPSTMKENT